MLFRLLVLAFSIYFLLLCILHAFETFVIHSIKPINCMENYFDMIVCICLPERKVHMTRVFKKWGFTRVIFSMHI